MAQDMAASILLLGDSNLSYAGDSGRWRRLWSCLRGTEDTSVVERTCGHAGCAVSFPLQQLRLGQRELLSLVTVVAELPSPTWAYIHAGQNDADYWSRRSTRTEELEDTFRQHLL